jgi:hypothetical protein
MIRAVIRNGAIEPLERLPQDWQDGHEVVVGDPEQQLPDSADDFETWLRDMATLTAGLNDPQEWQQFEASLAEADRQSKVPIFRRCKVSTNYPGIWGFLMNRPVGFSTGALAYDKFHEALPRLRGRRIAAIALSALREQELLPLLDTVDSLDLSAFAYASFHAPSARRKLSEEFIVDQLRRLLPKRWPIIVHPDAIDEPHAWAGFGSLLCLENMDKRKPHGRTVAEMDKCFELFPEASFCFDIGHARQVDPSMHQAAAMLRKYSKKLKQIHISKVNTRSKHEAISYSALEAFRKVAHLIPDHIPLIIESVIPESRIDSQIATALQAVSAESIPA